MTSSPHNSKDFSEKYQLYGEMIYRLSMVYLNSIMDSEDVMQEIFMKLLYKAPAFNDAEYEKRWVLRITINACKNKLNESWRKNRQSFNEEIYTLSTEEDYFIAETILALPSKLKAPIHLYYFERYKVNEIAQIIGISSSAVKMRLKRGRDILKLELEDNG